MPDKDKVEGENPKNYFAAYYADNKVQISERRKRKYATDPLYREEAKKRALARHHRIREDRPTPSGTDPLAHGARGYNKPRVIVVNGQPILCRGVAEFADRIGRDVQTITVWEGSGVVPPPTGRDELNRRWYSDAHIEFVRGVVLEFQQSGSRRLADFKELVQKRWKKAVGN